MSNHAKIGFIASLAAAVLLLGGCGANKTPEQPNPAVSSMGVINVQKAIQAHPRYSAYQELERQFNTLAAQAQAQQTPAGTAPNASVPDSALQGINDALNQEFNAKMSEKQQEINSRLSQKAEKLHRDLSGEFDSYGQEIDQTYQSQIFSLQLKLKTVQLAKEEMEKLQKQLEDLQSERSAKLSAKEKELAGRLEAAMAPEKAAAEQELNAYAAQLHASLAKQGEAKSAELANRLQPSSTEPAAGRSDLEQQAALKRQEVQAMQNAIIKDIENQAAKVAAQKSLEAVLANYSVNITAVDITDAVIAEFKK